VLGCIFLKILNVYFQEDNYSNLKFGFSRTTDIACRWIRKKKITREEGTKLVMHNDHLLEQISLEDFNKFLGDAIKDFWEIGNFRASN